MELLSHLGLLCYIEIKMDQCLYTMHQRRLMLEALIIHTYLGDTNINGGGVNNKGVVL